MDTELKPCPFCAGDIYRPGNALVWTCRAVDTPPLWLAWVRCTDCESQSMTVRIEGEERARAKAIEIWNTRRGD